MPGLGSTRGDQRPGRERRRDLGVLMRTIETVGVRHQVESHGHPRLGQAQVHRGL